VARLGVAVVGCGTGGPAAARLLAASGHRVTLFERFTDPQPLGAGILLQPTGQAMLDRLGVLDRVAAGSAIVDRVYAVSHNGRVVMDFGCADVEPGLHAYGVHRGLLFHSLFDRTIVHDNRHRYSNVLYEHHRGTRVTLGLLPNGVGLAAPPLYWSVESAALEAMRRHEPAARAGTNMALLDAAALADAIEAHAGRDLGAALAAYDAAQRRHITVYTWMSRLMTPLFQSKLAFLGPPRDLLLEPESTPPDPASPGIR
jgi:2-polyprenyl-6-methoxyphenol hydroxylase-like FAD-dependent oxidoreductase